RNIRHEMTVHHVDVKAVSAPRFGLRDLLSQAREISGENGRSDLNRAFCDVGHARCFLLYSTLRRSFPADSDESARSSSCRAPALALPCFPTPGQCGWPALYPIRRPTDRTN